MASKQATKTGDVTMDDLNTQIAVLKDDIAALTTTMGEYGKGKAQAVKNATQETAQGLTDAGMQKANDVQAQAEEFVRGQPTTALGIAAGVGFLAGILTARR